MCAGCKHSRDTKHACMQQLRSRTLRETALGRCAPPPSLAVPTTATAIPHTPTTSHGAQIYTFSPAVRASAPFVLAQVVGFLSVALGMPDSYAFSKPQLAEFYVHHHFLYFTQHYHKLPSSGSVASALCKSHLQVRTEHERCCWSHRAVS
jgi:hypothetical protein